MHEQMVIQLPTLFFPVLFLSWNTFWKKLAFLRERNEKFLIVEGKMMIFPLSVNLTFYQLL